jgi:hypothetical protein
LRLQKLAARYALLEREDPAKMLALNAKVARYENDLKARGVTNEGLSILQHPTRYVSRYLIIRSIVLILLTPVAIVGAVIHSPAYLFSALLGRIFRTHDIDVAGSSSTIVAAIGLMPLTWVIVASILWYYFGWETALISIPAMIVCGYIALRWSETLVDMQVWLRSMWLLFRQRALFLRLLVQRKTLQKEIGELAER